MEIGKMFKQILAGKCEIHIKYDLTSDNKKDNFTKIKGTTTSILSAISMLVHHLVEEGVSEQQIKYAIDLGLQENKKEYAENTVSGSITLEGEKAKDFMEFLKGLGVK